MNKAGNSIYLNQLSSFLNNIKPLEIIPTGAIPSYDRNNNFKAIIFDIYGTLVISASGDIMQADYNASMYAEALKNSGFKINIPEEDLMKIHPIFEKNVIEGKNQSLKNGIPYPELNIVSIWQKTLQELAEKKLITFTDSADTRLFTFIFELKSNQVWPMPELKETIVKLQQKYPLGIVSNAQFYTPVMMNYFLYNKINSDEFIDGFEKDLSVFSYKILKGKPDISVYEELIEPLKKREFKSSDVLFVGNDMLKDIYAASKLGFRTCFFAGDKRAYRLRKDHAEASKVKPDYIITELNQLLEILL